jgi:uracil-DNA glycosylase
METTNRFPFGQPVLPVVQTDRTPKRVFVLGVYSSAVHAKWIGSDGKVVVRALAVRSEPYIFWRGDGAEKLIADVQIPAAAGRLVPADNRLNGPSGIALDEQILKPMGLGRNDAWLCDLVCHSCMNPRQEDAIKTRYSSLTSLHDLPESSVPPVPDELASDERCRQILAELEESRANVLILLGDQPIRWFLKDWKPAFKRLSDLPEYGRLHRQRVGEREIHVLPLAHPRQIAKLGQSSEKWFKLHEQWTEFTAPSLLSRVSG